MTNAPELNQIREFYTETDCWLERLWSGPSRMIHFGYFPDAEGKSISHDESLLETVRQAAIRLHSQPGQYVLDAGCGYGGGSVLIARENKVRVKGITNLKLHAEKAAELARAQGFSEEQVSFEVCDYRATPFADATFDGVMAIESACYALEKADFLREMFRVLKPGGWLSVLDAFRTTPASANSAEGEVWMKSWLEGWGATEIDTMDEFTEKAQQAGFVKTKMENLQAHFEPSHYRCYKSARWLTPILGALHKVGAVSSSMYGYSRAGRDAYLAAHGGLCIQGIFSAQKPVT